VIFSEIAFRLARSGRGATGVGEDGTFTYRAQWFDRLMNLGPLGDPVSCAVTG
jgi:hypothetical protein